MPIGAIYMCNMTILYVFYMLKAHIQGRNYHFTASGTLTFNPPFIRSIGIDSIFCIICPFFKNEYMNMSTPILYATMVAHSEDL